MQVDRSTTAHGTKPKVVVTTAAYPETLGESSNDWFHDSTVKGIVSRLESLAQKQHAPKAPSVDRFAWSVRATEMDERFEQVMNRGSM